MSARACVRERERVIVTHVKLLDLLVLVCVKESEGLLKEKYACGALFVSPAGHGLGGEDAEHPDRGGRRSTQLRRLPGAREREHGRGNQVQRQTGASRRNFVVRSLLSLGLHRQRLQRKGWYGVPLLPVQDAWLLEHARDPSATPCRDRPLCIHPARSLVP